MTLIYDWLSSLGISCVIQKKKFGWVKTFLDLAKDFLFYSRGQARSRGTRTMLYIPVGCGTAHSFSDTRIMPYTHWGSVSVKVREHQHRERTPSGVVFWTAAEAVRGNERIKEFEGGRRPTKRCSRTVAERQRCTDDQTEYPRVGVNEYNWRANPFSWHGKNDFPF